MINRKTVSASDAAEILSEKLGVPLVDLVDIFAEIPSVPAVECKHCGRGVPRSERSELWGFQGKPIRFPVAFHAACYELAAGAIMEKVCDKYCRFPCECKSQEELDKHCDSCEIIELLDLIFKKKKEKP